MDRFFDNHVATPQQKIVFDVLWPETSKDTYGIPEAHEQFDSFHA